MVESLQQYYERLPILASSVGIPDASECLEDVAPGHVDLGPARMLFQMLLAAISEQVPMLRGTFPDRIDAVPVLLTRLVDRHVRPFVITMMAQTAELGSDTRYKALSGLYMQSSEFGEHLDSLQPGLRSLCTLALDELSSEPVARYLESELASFKQQATFKVEAWNVKLSQEDTQTEQYLMSRVNVQSAKRDFLSVFRKVVRPTTLDASTFVRGDVSIATPPSATHVSPVLPTNVELDRNTSSTGHKDAPTTELAARMALLDARLVGIRTLLSIELGLQLIQLARSAVERMRVFADDSGGFRTEVLSHCEAVFQALLSILGLQHIVPGFDQAIKHLTEYRSRQAQNDDHKQDQHQVEPLITFLELVTVGDLLQQMIDVFYVQGMVHAKLTHADDFLNPAVKAKKAFEQALDSRVADGMEKGIDVLMSHVDLILAKTQRAAVYNVPEASAASMPDIGPTATARSIVSIMTSHTSMLPGSAARQVLDVFLSEVGSRLFTALCKYIRGQRISVDGAITLIRYVVTFESQVDHV